MDIDAIEYVIVVGEKHCWKSDEPKYIKAREQLSALIANQIPGCCKDCAKYTHGVNCEYCNIEGCAVEPNHYCSYYTARTAAEE